MYPEYVELSPSNVDKMVLSDRILYFLNEDCIEVKATGERRSIEKSVIIDKT